MLFAPGPCRASIRTKQLIYSSQFHVTYVRLHAPFACSTVLQVFILLMADNPLYNSRSPKPFQSPRLWSNMLRLHGHLRRPTNLGFWYLFLYFDTLFARPRDSVYVASFRPGFLHFPVRLSLCAFYLFISLLLTFVRSPCPVFYFIPTRVM